MITAHPHEDDLDHRPIRVSVLPGTPLVATGFWSLMDNHGARVVQTPPGRPSEVVVAIVNPALGSPLPAPVGTPMMVLVPDRATAELVRDRGGFAVPLEATGLQMVTAVEATLLGGPRPHRVDGVTSPLSPREHQIITLISAGFSNRQIAAELFLGENSVKTYVRTAYRKMGVNSRTSAVRWGLRHGYGKASSYTPAEAP